MVRALSPLVALYLLSQLALLPFVVAERNAAAPEPPAATAPDSLPLPLQPPPPDSLGPPTPPPI